MTVHSVSSDRFEGMDEVKGAWADFVCLNATPTGSGVPALNASVRRVEALTIGAFTGSAVRLERTRSMAQNCSNDVILCIDDRTRLRATWDGVREREFRPGDLHIWQADRSMSCETSSDFSALMLTLSRDHLARHRIDIDSLLRKGGHVADKPEVRLFSNYVRSFCGEAELLSQPSIEQCAAHILDLVHMVFGVSVDTINDGKGRGVRAARLKAIQTDIKSHLTDPELGVAWISKRHCISERYLRALFADERTSFTDFVLEQRLIRAHDRLCDPAWRHETIAFLAFESGFGDLTWFNRAFRKRFGMTPSDTRNAFSSGLLLRR
ncbi:MAG: hypothetical protein CVU15_11185 [Betaproteobacteria bacterium HGW-Betaproteobacteria-1]|jgi:AraC-like DNA-binding protein|nr:MAG: hypothetical protein CVU15_11185 [Betaproteobacteria bacterium HGW-Betaproteobacteria-1]